MSIQRSNMRLTRLASRLAAWLGLLRLRRAFADDRGSVLALTVLVLPIVLGFLGLMLDGSLLYAARRELQDGADSAALAGAMQADLEYFAQTGKWRIAETSTVPGTRSANDAVQEVCSIYGIICTVEVPSAHQGRLLRVTAEAEFGTLFLHLIMGKQTFKIGAQSSAILVAGY